MLFVVLLYTIKFSIFTSEFVIRLIFNNASQYCNSIQSFCVTTSKCVYIRKFFDVIEDGIENVKGL